MCAQTYRIGSSLVDPENRGHAELKELIRDVVECYQPVIIGEEASADVLRSAQRNSVAYDAAREIGIKHRYCDPTWDQRYKLSIGEELPFLGPGPPFEWEALIPSLDVAHRHDIAHRWPVREEFWLDSLGDELNHQKIPVSSSKRRRHSDVLLNAT